MAILTVAEIEQWLTAHDKWRFENDQLCLSLRFENFNAAWGFLCRAALIAEQQKHHPEWCNACDRVEIVLISHDEGGVTARDLKLAEAMETLLD